MDAIQLLAGYAFDLALAVDQAMGNHKQTS